MLLSSFWRGVWAPFKSIMSMGVGIAVGFVAAMFVFGVIHVPSKIFLVTNMGRVPSHDLQKSPYKNEIEAAAFSSGIDPNILHAIVEIESGGDRFAESEAGAQGLVQLMPTIQDSFGVVDPFDPVQNLSGGAAFLSSLLDKYDRIDLAIAAYHAGEPMVDECQCVPREIDAEYVSRFMKAFKPVVLPYRIEFSQTQGMHGGGLPGRDYAVECGTPIYAPINGEIAALGLDGFVGPHGSNNSFVKIDGIGNHAGIQIIMLHGEYNVSVGDKLIQGVTNIGREASVGNSTGCHTHFTMRLNGVFVDPDEFISY